LASTIDFDPSAKDQSWIHSLPILDDAQAGSLRRIHELAAQLPDDWSGMMGQSTLQEDFGSLRFQLAYMSYALAVTHVHRLPAAPVAFHGAFNSLIQKMLSPDVWMYWHYVSTGKGPFNKSLGDLPAEWDPVVKDNIMYSAYIQSMALLYHYLFRDDRYAAPGALTFSINSLFWGEGGKHFAYDERSLNQHLYWGMAERGFLGIACEPNCVFQICNQVPIWGFRFHDLVYGGDVAKEVTDGYLKAWREFGGVLTPDGHFNMMVLELERTVISPPERPWVDFWMGALMHAWNPELVERQYPTLLRSWLMDGPDGTLCIKPVPPIDGEGPPIPSPHDFGWAAVLASEVGDSGTLRGLLAYADRFLHPVRSNGSYYYRRHDEPYDDQGRSTIMDPHTGNVLLPFARLNVKDGLRKLFDGPWDSRHFGEPALVHTSRPLDIRRAYFSPDKNALALTLLPIEGGAVRMTIANAVNRGNVSLTRNGVRADDAVSIQGDQLLMDLEIAESTNLVLSWPC